MAPFAPSAHPDTMHTAIKPAVSALLNNVATGVMTPSPNIDSNASLSSTLTSHYGDGTAGNLQERPARPVYEPFETDLFPFPGSQPFRQQLNMLHLPFASNTGSRVFRATVREQWLPN